MFNVNGSETWSLGWSGWWCSGKEGHTEAAHEVFHLSGGHVCDMCWSGMWSGQMKWGFVAVSIIERLKNKNMMQENESSLASFSTVTRHFLGEG